MVRKSFAFRQSNRQESRWKVITYADEKATDRGLSLNAKQDVKF